MSLRRNDNNIITIRGLVIPVEWDENGRVVDIAIATFDEDQYFIEAPVPEKNLLNKIGQSVVVSGVIKKIENKNIISISNLL